ncbi:hypothetical protein [Tepidibacter aestuarii]|uniref:hypothetical protein n=1 Tax=Tepidibacter aestuarii TaxID=2925782 RepID=UPI0020BF23A3|nr:hypothetical protein [Tepidibacter aestuarii]CAH2213479.1 membrane protein of unknown function [Tepidibacter aestuarii]
MNNTVRLIKIIFISIAINVIGILCFGLLFATLYLYNSVIVGTEMFFYSYLGLYFLLNIGFSYFLVVKKGVNKLFYVHILISFLAIIPLMFLMAAVFI